MNKYVNIRSWDLFEEMLNAYASIGDIKLDLGTQLRDKDLDRFKELFEKWCEECVTTPIMRKTRSSLTHKRYAWSPSRIPDEETAIKEGVKILKQMEL